jgi:putative oxidoreductase
MTSPKAVDIAALLLRLTLGAAFLAHAGLKLVVFTLPGTVAFFESIGYPGALAYVITFAELAGGVALITGFQVRLVSLLAVPILLGALVQHAGNGWMFANAGGGWEFPAFWAMTLVVQALLGPGALALRVPGLPEIVRLGAAPARA